MYIDEIQKALSKIYEIYGSGCCVDKIQGHIITMTNFDKWVFDHDGNICRYDEDWN